jgi:hypothetical protein
MFSELLSLLSGCLVFSSRRGTAEIRKHRITPIFRGNWKTKEERQEYCLSQRPPNINEIKRIFNFKLAKHCWNEGNRTQWNNTEIIIKKIIATLIFKKLETNVQELHIINRISYFRCKLIPKLSRIYYL